MFHLPTTQTSNSRGSFGDQALLPLSSLREPALAKPAKVKDSEYHQVLLETNKDGEGKEEEGRGGRSSWNIPAPEAENQSWV